MGISVYGTDNIFLRVPKRLWALFYACRTEESWIISFLVGEFRICFNLVGKNSLYMKLNANDA